MLLLASSTSSAQLVVDNAGPNGSPRNLVQNVLMGNGVIASNVVFRGDSTIQIGFFDGTASNIGVPTGVIIATGHIAVALGPNDEEGAAIPPLGMGAQGDGDLSILMGITTSDAGALEFDFIPAGDSIIFKYVFASEEYNEFVCSQWNDVFGFFISGPGYSGPFSNGAENIALLPDTNIPVAINTVNNGKVGDYGQLGGCGGWDQPGLKNASYFVDNDDPPGATVQYDGFTTVLKARAYVQCGQTYHIKIVVADGGPSSGAYYDSAVFLEAESFYSPGVTVSVNTSTGDLIIVEGCDEGVLLFNRPDTIGNLTVAYDIQGSASNGVDYQFIADSIQIVQGQHSSELVISPFADGIIEGLDTLEITIYNITPCGDTIPQTVTMVIQDEYDIAVDAGLDISTCAGYSTVLSASASGGIPEYSFLWDNGDTYNSITLFPVEADTLIVNVTDAAGCEGQDSLIISIIPLPAIELGNDTSLCEGETISYTMTNNNTTFIWQDSSILPSYTVTQEGVYWLEVLSNGCLNSDTVRVDYDPLPSVDLGADTTFCQDETLVLDASFQDATYLWQDNSDFPSLPVTDAGTYWVNVLNICGTASDTLVADLDDCDCQLCVPDAFTPNGSGLLTNDKFYVFNKLGYRGDVLETINFKVYDRWGQVVFEAIDATEIIYPQGGWDGTHMKTGKKLEVGVYVWLMNATTSESGALGPLSGNVTLIR